MAKKTESLRSVFASNVVRMLTAYGWSQKKLAIRSNLDQSHISRLLHSKSFSPRFCTLEAIAEAFGVPAHELLIPR